MSQPSQGFHARPIAVMPVELPLPDGSIIRGEFTKAPEGDSGAGAILVHDIGTDRDLSDWAGLIEPILGAGVNGLAIDLPGHGMSDDPIDGAASMDALIAAHRFLVDLPVPRCFVFAVGASMASAVALADDIRALGLVAIAPHPPASLQRPTRPKFCPSLLISSSATEETEALKSWFPLLRGWAVSSVFDGDPLNGPWRGHVGEQVGMFLRRYRA